MKILITEPTYKHAIALARYLKAYDSSIELIGVSSYRPKFPSLFARYYDEFLVGALEDIVAKEQYDLLIPVGNASVAKASALQLRKVVLPSQGSINVGLNKALTLDVARRLGIPVPRTHILRSVEDIDTLDVPFPCVVKGLMEAGKNVVSYPSSREELKEAFDAIHGDPTQEGHLPAIQEYIPGVGLGFFGFYQHGQLKRFYMHQRIREYPLSGGASTAAKTIFHPEAFEYGKKLLDHLQWHGPAMVEFKYDPLTGKLALMEINPKFWGSTELGLAAGVNFGELLVRTMKDENIPAMLSPDAYKRVSFYWPFEGDLAALAQLGQWSELARCYWRKGSHTNVRTNGFLLNCFRVADFMRGKR